MLILMFTFFKSLLKHKILKIVKQERVDVFYRNNLIGTN